MGPVYSSRPPRASHYQPDPADAPKTACGVRSYDSTATTRYVTCGRCERTAAFKQRRQELSDAGVKF